MITILHRGEGSLGTPKSDYVICAQPLIEGSPLSRSLLSFRTRGGWTWGSKALCPADQKIDILSPQCNEGRGVVGGEVTGFEQSPKQNIFSRP